MFMLLESFVSSLVLVDLLKYCVFEGWCVEGTIGLDR